MMHMPLAHWAFTASPLSCIWPNVGRNLRRMDLTSTPQHHLASVCAWGFGCECVLLHANYVPLASIVVGTFISELGTPCYRKYPLYSFLHEKITVLLLWVNGRRVCNRLNESCEGERIRAELQSLGTQGTGQPIGLGLGDRFKNCEKWGAHS